MGILRPPLELVHETGLIGWVLRKLPRHALEEAETKSRPWAWLAKWCERNPVEYEFAGPASAFNAEVERREKEGFKKTGFNIYSASTKARRKTRIREVHFYFHKDDPNKRVQRIIMDSRWSASYRKTFEAADSQQAAILRLVEIGRGGGSIHKSWRSRIQAAQRNGDLKQANRWANKLAASILRTERGRRWLLEDKSSPAAFREEARRRYEAFYAADVRRLGKKKADRKWRNNSTDPQQTSPFKLQNSGDRIAVAMAVGWLTLPCGWPGYCFLSDEVIATVLGCMLPLPSLLSENSQGWKTVRTIRERIGLKKGEILIRGVRNLTDTEYSVLDYRGRKVGSFKATRAPLPPKL